MWGIPASLKCGLFLADNQQKPRRLAKPFVTMTRFASLSLSIFLLASLVGCDMLGIESPEKLAAARDAEGRAIGGGCRHAGRAIEDCYTLNRRADKAAMFTGWRDMNDYMRENNLEPVIPVISAQAPAAKASEPEHGAVKKEKDKGKEAAKSASKGSREQGS